MHLIEKEKRSKELEIKLSEVKRLRAIEDQELTWDIQQEELYPHPKLCEPSNENKTILRKDGDYEGSHFAFGNKVLYKGKNVIHMKLDVYEKHDF